MNHPVCSVVPSVLPSAVFLSHFQTAPSLGTPLPTFLGSHGTSPKILALWDDLRAAQTIGQNRKAAAKLSRERQPSLAHSSASTTTQRSMYSEDDHTCQTMWHVETACNGLKPDPGCSLCMPFTCLGWHLGISWTSERSSDLVQTL